MIGRVETCRSRCRKLPILFVNRILSFFHVGRSAIMLRDKSLEGKHCCVVVGIEGLRPKLGSPPLNGTSDLS